MIDCDTDDAITGVSVDGDAFAVSRRWEDPYPELTTDYTTWERAEFGTLSGGSGLFGKTSDSVEMGHDGDDDGRPATHQAVSDMLDSGHGFLVREREAGVAIKATTCEVCGGPLPPSVAELEWVCEFDGPATEDCGCNGCGHYREWLAGQYAPRGGRPRKRCGTTACKREADRLRKRRERGSQLVPSAQKRTGWVPGTLLPRPVKRVFSKYREPNWHLSHLRKRVAAGELARDVLKTP